ncbi:MAG: hypothetical protein ABWY16_15595 [Pedobacter sp.]|uniref:hypothetical protein n=1 Tax=Pedobacter sp. TaxID=1411316 RepID=UPI00339A4954
MIYKTVPVCFFFLFLKLSGQAQSPVSGLKSISFTDIQVSGELATRALKNYDRLESSIYTPAKVFPVLNLNVPVQWPGDIEGRIILGLVLQAQATHREPKYLSEIIRLLPEKVNKDGYFGPVQKDTINEQQLSGNGWFLRGLCEYYKWKKDPKIKGYIAKVIRNLALPTKGQHRIYPIDPTIRNKTVGAASGTTQATVGHWKLSSDIGCNFIFMDGVVQAYEIVPSEELKSLIDEMISRFLEMDLKAMNAQTHASLTGLRALLRYYTMTKSSRLLDEVRKRYGLYRSHAMTANFENFNWFGRPEWTEPCAIVDSYMLAVQLWQITAEPLYLEDAHHIYFNAIANTQRANGGFGLSNCTRPNFNSLRVDIDEASWCCTMRGAEGLASAVKYNYFTGTDQLAVPFYCNSKADLKLKDGIVTIQQTSAYPFRGVVNFSILKSSLKFSVLIKLIAPSWTNNHKLKINDVEIPVLIKDGFIVFRRKMIKGDRIELSFLQDLSPVKMINDEYNLPDFYTINYGPLVLGYNNKDKQEQSFKAIPEFKRISDMDWLVEGTEKHLSPVYHLLDPQVSKESGHSKQVLFRIDNQR